MSGDQMLSYALKIEDILKPSSESVTNTESAILPVNVDPLPVNTRTRLPKLVLPRFKGDVTKCGIHSARQCIRIHKF